MLLRVLLEGKDDLHILFGELGVSVHLRFIFYGNTMNNAKYYVISDSGSYFGMHVRLTDFCFIYSS